MSNSEASASVRGLGFGVWGLGFGGWGLGFGVWVCSCGGGWGLGVGGWGLMVVTIACLNRKECNL